MSIMEPENWAKWTNSFGKAQPPPDFYSSRLGLMMEAMRIDDHSRLGRKGSPINPTNVRESHLQKEFERVFPGVPKFINACSDLPGIDDHNYGFYLENFKRTVIKHAIKVSLYRKNHPNFKLIFYVFDESSAYMEAESKKTAQKGILSGQAVKGKRHLYPLDRNMLSCLNGCDIDFLVWHTPFKRYFNASESFQLPNLSIINLRQFSWGTLLDYKADYMMSMEE